LRAFYLAPARLRYCSLLTSSNQLTGEPFSDSSGYHLYYPSRRQQSPALALLVEALRYRG